MPDLVPLPGSERSVLPDVQPAGTLDPTEPVSITLVLRRRAQVPAELIVGPETMSPDDMTTNYGASPQDVELVRSTLRDLGLTVTDVHAGSRRVSVSGTVASMESAFGTSLELVTSVAPGG